MKKVDERLKQISHTEYIKTDITEIKGNYVVLSRPEKKNIDLHSFNSFIKRKHFFISYSLLVTEKVMPEIRTKLKHSTLGTNNSLYTERVVLTSKWSIIYYFLQ